MNRIKQSAVATVALATPNAAVRDHWAAALADYPLFLIDDRVALEQYAAANTTVKPSLIVCDEVLIQSGRDRLLTALGQLAGGTPILMMVADDPEMVDIEWIYCGVRGCCLQMLEADMLNKAVATLLTGEAWLPRRLIARVITTVFDEAVATVPLKQDDSLLLLTPRECEVAKLVTEGLNNKLIARQLDISERTIKAHLGNIFQKLGIDNRLMLAMTLKNSF